MRVFTVGIAGGVGSRLARLLTAAGDRVDGLYRRSEQGERLATEDIHATHGDLTRLDASALAALLHDTDVLVFAAGAGGEGGTAATTVIDGTGLTILRPAALTDDAGTGRISLSPALVHTDITRDDVAATLAELIHAPPDPPPHPRTHPRPRTHRRRRPPTEPQPTGSPPLIRSSAGRTRWV